MLRQSEADPSSHRVPEVAGARDLQVVEHRDHVGGPRRQVVSGRIVGLVAPSVPSRVDQDEPVGLGQGVGLAGVTPGVAARERAVVQEQRRAVALHGVMDADAPVVNVWHGVLASRPGHQPLSSFFSAARNRQSVPWAIRRLGCDLSMPVSCRDIVARVRHQPVCGDIGRLVPLTGCRCAVASFSGHGRARASPCASQNGMFRSRHKVVAAASCSAASCRFPTRAYHAPSPRWHRAKSGRIPTSRARSAA